jgi:hypothetical protein
MTGLFSIQKGGSYARILCEMPYQERNERCQGRHSEKWPAGNSRSMPSVRNQDVQNRQGLSPEYKKFQGSVNCSRLGIYDTQPQYMVSALLIKRRPKQHKPGKGDPLDDITKSNSRR